MLRYAVVIALAASPVAGQDVGFGQDLYGAFCISCHGAEGRGDGEMAALLTVPPADLTQLAAQNGGVFPVFEVTQQIDGRGPGRSHSAMPVFGQYFGMEEVAIPTEAGQPIIVSAPLASLAAYVESLQE